MTRPDTRPADGVDVAAALAHLDEAGIPEQVLTSAGIDITAPAVLRAEVEKLLIAAVAEDSIADGRQVLLLQAAYEALFTADERAHLTELAETISIYLALVTGRPAPTVESNRRRREDDLPWFGAECLEAD